MSIKKVFFGIRSAIRESIFFAGLLGIVSFIFWGALDEGVEKISFYYKKSTIGVITKLDTNAYEKVIRHTWLNHKKVYDTVRKERKYIPYIVYYKYYVNGVVYKGDYDFQGNLNKFNKLHRLRGDSILVKYITNFPNQSKIYNFNIATIGTYVGLVIITIIFFVTLFLYVYVTYTNFIKIDLSGISYDDWDDFESTDLIWIELFICVNLFLVFIAYYTIIRYI